MAKKEEKEKSKIVYEGQIEKTSELLLEETKKTISEMDSYYPKLLSSFKDGDNLEEEVQSRKESLKRARRNVLNSYQMLFDLSDELSGRWADIKSSYSHSGRKLGVVNAEIDIREKEINHFSHGINIYKVLWLIFIGSFAGVVIEILWCFLRHGYIESRQGLVYGPFNLLYGVGAALLSISLYKYRNHSSWISFLGGFIVGSVLEYVCSWGQELVVGSRSWDYSNVPLNINGRICLLYSLFWGVLGVVWIKKIYPVVSEWILKIPNKVGKPLTWVILLFFIFDSFVSLSALIRWSQRMENLAPKNRLEIVMDEKFPNEKMEKIFPNMVFKEE